MTGLSRVFRLTISEILYIIVIGMLAVTMYVVVSIVEPIKTILERSDDSVDIAIRQNREIISNQNNATRFLDAGRLLADQREDATVENLTKRIDLLENDTRSLILVGRAAAAERFDIETEQQRQIEALLNATTQSLNNTNRLIQQDANLTASERAKLVDALRDNIAIVPEIRESLRQANEFWSFLRNNFDESYLEAEYRQYAQSNDTQDKLDRLLAIVNATQ